MENATELSKKVERLEALVKELRVDLHVYPVRPMAGTNYVAFCQESVSTIPDWP